MITEIFEGETALLHCFAHKNTTHANVCLDPYEPFYLQSLAVVQI